MASFVGLVCGWSVEQRGELVVVDGFSSAPAVSWAGVVGWLGELVVVDGFSSAPAVSWAGVVGWLVGCAALCHVFTRHSAARPIRLTLR